MTLLQRISRNVKDVILIFPRSGSKRRGLNIIFITLLFMTFTIYLSERKSQRPEEIVKHQGIQKRDLAAVKEIEGKIETKVSLKQMVKKSSTKLHPAVTVTRLVTAVQKEKSSTSSTSTTSLAPVSPEKLLNAISKNIKNVKNCTKHSPKLVGDMKSNPNITPTMEEVIKHVGSDMQQGGCFAPTTCKALQKVAIIIPFKDRDAHLKTLLYYLHPMLMRQRLHYCIYVAEQFDNGQFNKANIMNAAFEEALKLDDYDCIVFHDVDMIPENDKNFYMCGKSPRHLSPAIDKFQYKPHYGTEFGGVTGITPAQYRKANGHSNRFWGWGGEDNDMEFRIQLHNMSIIPSSLEVGRYMMIPHLHPWKFSPNKFPYKLNNTRHRRAAIDGLSDLQYRLTDTLRFPLYTKLMLDIRKIKMKKLTLYIDGKPAMDIDLNPGECRYEEFHGKYLDFVIELTNKKEAQDLPLWPGIKTNGKPSLLKDSLIAPDGKKRRFSMLHDLNQAQELCEKLVPECSGIQKENNQENYSLRKGSILRHLVIRGPRGQRPPSAVQPHDQDNSKTDDSRRYILPDKKAYLRYCPGDFSHWNAYKKPLFCAEDSNRRHTYGFDVHFTVMLKPLEYLFYSDDKHFESHLEKGSNHHTFTWPNNTPPDPSKLNSTRIFNFRTPDFVIPSTPGSYAIESKIADKLHNPYFQWNWWFEVTTGDKVTDAKVRDAYWKKKMNENVVKASIRRHAAMLKAKAAKARRNQEEFSNKMMDIQNQKKIAVPPDIKKLVKKIQNNYDKRNVEANQEEFDANNPAFQAKVGVIKLRDERDGLLKTTTKTKPKTMSVEYKRFHMKPKSKVPKP